jgi:hypothetical protein
MKGMSLAITEELIGRQTMEAQAIIRALLAKIQELQDRLNQSPRNSSVPPSAEHPHAKPPRPRSRALRRRGGQPGHPRHERPLLPSGQCDEVIGLLIQADRHHPCGLASAGPRGPSQEVPAEDHEFGIGRHVQGDDDIGLSQRSPRAGRRPGRGLLAEEVRKPDNLQMVAHGSPFFLRLSGFLFLPFTGLTPFVAGGLREGLRVEDSSITT